jgi:single-stranded DNA-binding protein
LLLSALPTVEGSVRMDLNLVVVSGRLAAPPEIRQFESGARLARYLVTVRSEEPARRVDVLPVTLWDPTDELVDAEPTPGTRVWVAGSVQRRFWSGSDGRRSRIELVADQVCVREAEDDSLVDVAD